MYKTEDELDMDPGRYISKLDGVSSRFLQNGKKKYYLAGIDQNYQQLREDQLKELTGVLVNLKSEFDGLIRETTNKKKETDKLGKQIDMLEKMEKKSKNKFMEKEDHNSNLQSMMEIKKTKKEDETFQRTTLMHQHQKMKDEIFAVKKEINLCETETKRLEKVFGQERIKENTIKDKINQQNSNLSSFKLKSVQDKTEFHSVLNYYNNVIDQKWAFIHSADERKEKQIRIAQEAKNDTQDQQEVEKRKMLSLCMLFNKYLRKKMEKELKDNRKVEETFQTIKDITGSSNLKTMVDKILSKDKNYNSHVSKVTEKEIRIDILRKDITTLEDEYQQLKNDFTDDSLNETQKKEKEQFLLMETEEKILMEQEKNLENDLKEYQDKHKQVKLVYEKVFENIKGICKLEKKKIEEVQNSSIQNSSADHSNELDLSQNVIKVVGPSEEEVSKHFIEYLENTRGVIERLYLTVGMKEFQNLLKERGERNPSLSSANKNKEKLGKSTSKRNVNETKSPSNTNTGNTNANYEYNYSDEELKEDDKRVKDEYNSMAQEFKKIERQKFLEALRTDKEKK